MSDYTPSTEEIRRDYVACKSSPQASMSDDDLVPIYVSRWIISAITARGEIRAIEIEKGTEK